MTDASVERHAVARTHDHDVGAFDFADGKLADFAVAFDARGLRAQFAQGFDGAPRLFHRAVLERVTEAEEKQQERALEPGAEKGRADGSKHHQRLDVNDALSQRDQCTADRKETARDHRQGEQHGRTRGLEAR